MTVSVSNCNIKAGHSVCSCKLNKGSINRTASEVYDIYSFSRSETAVVKCKNSRNRLFDYFNQSDPGSLYSRSCAFNLILTKFCRNSYYSIKIFLIRKSFFQSFLYFFQYLKGNVFSLVSFSAGFPEFFSVIHKYL